VHHTTLNSTDDIIIAIISHIQPARRHDFESSAYRQRPLHPIVAPYVRMPHIK